MEPPQFLELLIRVLGRRWDLRRRLSIGRWRSFSGGRLFLLLGLGLLVPGPGPLRSRRLPYRPPPPLLLPSA